jgi:hypothetical protein
MQSLKRLDDTIFRTTLLIWLKLFLISEIIFMELVKYKKEMNIY